MNYKSYMLLIIIALLFLEVGNGFAEEKDQQKEIQIQRKKYQKKEIKKMKKTHSLMIPAISFVTGYRKTEIGTKNAELRKTVILD